ncbi:MIP/aquaporin family protein [Nocardioides insulae]|uniref:MIP/aquaporin family protein n=1 Tax=Nocardioides insulae TaxID=394734 RepID=UPI000418FE9F|nr:MIP family channel protein [Nocardioides insulae]
MSDTATPTLVQKLTAEAIGTFVLVFFGCGSVIFAISAAGRDALALFPTITTVGLTFGIAIVVMVYAFGKVSGGHFNPAVSLGAAIAGRIAWIDAALYAAAQVVGALVGAIVLRILVEGFPAYDVEQIGLGQNAYGDLSPGDYSWIAAFGLELVMTFLFVMVILAVTDIRNDHPGMAPLAIGLTLAAIHFVAIPATGTSVNPARSIGPAIMTFDFDVILQLWLFILAPLVGAALAGLLMPVLFGRGDEDVPGSGLRFGAAPAAAPAWGAPDQLQQEWNQQQDWSQQGYPQQQGYAAPQPEQQAPQAPQSPAQHAAPWTDEEDGRTVIKGEGTEAPPPADQPVIIQDGWQWDYAAQQWKPVDQPPQG